MDVLSQRLSSDEENVKKKKKKKGKEKEFQPPKLPPQTLKLIGELSKDRRKFLNPKLLDQHILIRLLFLVYPDPMGYEFHTEFLSNDVLALQDSWRDTLRSPNMEERACIQSAIDKVLSEASESLEADKQSALPDSPDDWPLNMLDIEKPLSEGEDGDIQDHYPKVSR